MLDKYRRLFPACDRHTYLMAATAGPTPLPVLQALHEGHERMARDGGLCFAAKFDVIEDCRRRFATLINAEPDSVAIVPSTAFGMNGLVQALRLGPDASVVLQRDVSYSTTFPWVQHTRVRPVETRDGVEDGLVAAAPGAQAVVASLVHHADGHRLDVGRVAEALSPLGVPFIVDGTQGVGMMPLDVQAARVDALLCAGHKWLLCPEGVAFMYVRPGFLGRLRPALVGWRGACDPMAMESWELPVHRGARVFELGWPQVAAFAGVQAALRLVATVGIDRIWARVSGLMDHLRMRLDKAGVPVMSSKVRAAWSGIVLLGPFDDPEQAVLDLRHSGVLTTSKGRGVRVALHFYNDRNDIDHLIESLGRRRLAKRIQMASA